MEKSFQGNCPKTGQSVYINDSAVIIGDVEIDDDSSIWPTAVIRGDVNRIRIGRRTSIQDGTVIHVHHKASEEAPGHAAIIGDDVTVGHLSLIHI